MINHSAAKKSNPSHPSNHSKQSFYRENFSHGASNHFTAIILAGFYFGANKRNQSFQCFFRGWNRNINFLWSSALLLHHRFLKFRVKGWRPQRQRYIVPRLAARITRALCEWWAKQFAVTWTKLDPIILWFEPVNSVALLLPLTFDPGIPLVALASVFLPVEVQQACKVEPEMRR